MFHGEFLRRHDRRCCSRFFLDACERKKSNKVIRKRRSPGSFNPQYRKFGGATASIKTPVGHASVVIDQPLCRLALSIEQDLVLADTQPSFGEPADR